MIRTQIQLTAAQVSGLKRLAAERHVSMAAVIRDAVEAWLRASGGPSKEDLEKRALAAIGAFSGPADLAERHDDYFADAGLHDR